VVGADPPQAQRIAVRSYRNGNGNGRDRRAAAAYCNANGVTVSGVYAPLGKTMQVRATLSLTDAHARFACIQGKTVLLNVLVRHTCRTL
jgi:hypothetical protein